MDSLLVSHDPSFGSMANETEWSWLENKAFELAVAQIPEGTPDRWSLITARLPGKSPSQVADHYDALLLDLESIESGMVEPPDYKNEAVLEREEGDSSGGLPIFFRSQSRQQQSQVRRKAVPWTHEEHRSFTRGLKQYGKGDWKNISRYVVNTKTPTQVASHAQKYFLRMEQQKESKRKRKSIHDITDP